MAASSDDIEMAGYPGPDAVIVEVAGEESDGAEEKGENNSDFDDGDPDLQHVALQGPADESSHGG